MISSFCLRVAARRIVKACPSLKYTLHDCCWDVKQPTNQPKTAMQCGTSTPPHLCCSMGLRPAVSPRAECSTWHLLYHRKCGMVRYHRQKKPFLDNNNPPPKKKTKNKKKQQQNKTKQKTTNKQTNKTKQNKKPTTTNKQTTTTTTTTTTTKENPNPNPNKTKQHDTNTH